MTTNTHFMVPHSSLKKKKQEVISLWPASIMCPAGLPLILWPDWTSCQLDTDTTGQTSGQRCQHQLYIQLSNHNNHVECYMFIYSAHSMQTWIDIYCFTINGFVNKAIQIAKDKQINQFTYYFTLRFTYRQVHDWEVNLSIHLQNLKCIYFVFKSVYLLHFKCKQISFKAHYLK